jgi:putative hydrolase of the HAD superfamily
MKTAVLSNSLGRAPYDPYAPYDLPGKFDAVVFSDQHRLRKPDPAIFRLTCELLGAEPSQCVFVDDIASNLVPAEGMGMAVLECLDEKVAAPQLRRLLQI